MQTSLRCVIAKALRSLFPVNRKYIVLRGGLGNQLYQIAAGVKLCEIDSGSVRIFPYIVDKSTNSSRRGFFRNIDLAALFPGANISEVNLLEKIILTFVLKLEPSTLRDVMVNEENFFSHSHRYPFLLLRGWFQSAVYLPLCLNPASLCQQDSMVEDRLVVHVRLTDFATIDSNPLDSHYYREAMKFAPIEITRGKIICYSDDIQGALDILDNSLDLQFPESIQELSPFEVLTRLSSTNYLISSKSSLCKWASYAVVSRGGLVISPFDENPFMGNHIFLSS